MNKWKGKLDVEMEMADAIAMHGGLDRRGASRSAEGIEAELEAVARLLTGLPANAQPGEYRSKLEACLTSRSSALRLELEQKMQASGKGEPVRCLVACCPSGLLSAAASSASVSAAMACAQR